MTRLRNSERNSNFTVLFVCDTSIIFWFLTAVRTTFADSALDGRPREPKGTTPTEFSAATATSRTSDSVMSMKMMRISSFVIILTLRLDACKY